MSCKDSIVSSAFFAFRTCPMIAMFEVMYFYYLFGCNVYLLWDDHLFAHCSLWWSLVCALLIEYHYMLLDLWGPINVCSLKCIFRELCQNMNCYGKEKTPLKIFQRCKKMILCCFWMVSNNFLLLVIDKVPVLLTLVSIVKLTNGIK